MLPSQESKLRAVSGESLSRQGDNVAPAGEPVFILRASDPLALRALTAYLTAIDNPKHARAVSARIAQFKRFAQGLPAEERKMPTTSSQLPRRVAGVIRRLREATHLSQEAFADRAGIHRAQYAQLERGFRDIRLSSLERVAKGLKVPP